MKSCCCFVFVAFIAFAVAAPQSTVDANKSKFEKTMNLASPPVDLSKPPVVLPEATPIHEQPQELVSAHSHHEPKVLVSDSEWEEYKKNYNKTYKDAKDEKERRELFGQSKVRVEEHNKRYDLGEETYTMGINKFSDRKPDEKFHKGVILPSKKEEKKEKTT